ncbi:MAG: cytochrome c class, partial [Caulobacteraceae bacterium]|nr:cytochrome c class [Caulobacteraceae bacterium]
MSNLTGNKIAGGLLATFLIVVGVPQIAGMIFNKEPPAKPGMAVAVQEEAAAGPAADNPPDWGTVLAKADVNAGKASAQACASCHNLDSGGPNMTGPNLFGVVGRKPGSHPGFAYSSAMTDFGGKDPAWTFDALYTFLKAPGRDVQGTKMTFPGFKEPQTRINVIAY